METQIKTKSKAVHFYFMGLGKISISFRLEKVSKKI